jgi:hypothetical protein
MFCVHVASYELRTLTQDFRQDGFTVAVNRYDFRQLNDESQFVSCAVRFSPSRPELIRPLADQLTLQGPPLPVRQFGDSDLQHQSP